MLFLLIIMLMIVIINRTVVISYSSNYSYNVNEKNTIKVTQALITIILITVIAGIRSNVGDTPIYMESFVNYVWTAHNPFQFNELFNYIFNYLIRNIWDNPQILIICTSIIIYPCILWRFYKNSSDIVMTLLLFIMSCSFINSMNGIRQYLVTAILFFLYPWILNAKFYKTCFLLVFLSFFHSSVLFIIPVYYVSKFNPWSRKMFVIYILITILFIFFNQVSPTLFNFLESSGSKYTTYETAVYGQISVNILRILFSFIPTCLAFITRNFKEMKNKHVNFITNLSLFYFVFMLFGYYGANYSRFCLYFELYPLLLIPYILRYGFNEKSKKIMKVIIYIIFFAFLYYQIQIAWGGFSLESEWLGLVLR